MARNGRTRPYRLVDDIVTVGAKALVSQLHTPEAQAKELMRQIAHEVCFLNAKCVIYVPQDLDFELSQRDERIWADYQVNGPGPDGAQKYSGARVMELAAEHDLTVQQVYNIIRLMKKRTLPARAGGALK